MVNQVV